jgi:ADP-heptose:LPS heptosyltransferase
MLTRLLARVRLFSRQRRQQRLFAALNQVDAVALHTQAPSNPTRVMVLRNDSIGDYLLYRPWLRRLSVAVRSQGQQLTLVANALWAPLTLAWDADLFDDLLAVDFGRFATDLAYRARIVQTIGQQGFGEVIYPVHVREATAENFIRFLHAPVRIASQGAHIATPLFAQLDAGYTRLLPSTKSVLFEYDRNREFFEHWQYPEAATGTLASVTAPLHLPATVLAAGSALAANTPYVVLFPGASARQKRWPIKHFAQLAQGLHRHYGNQYRLIVAGSPADSDYAQRIIQVAGPRIPIYNQCGQTDLPQLAALVAGARLLISNDTVAAHLAAQAGTPCLVLLMGENYGKFFPYPPHLLQAPCRCLYPPSQEVRFAQGDFSPPTRDPLISRIEPSRVLATAIELLSEEYTRQMA